MTTDELRESLFAAPKNGYARITAEQRKEMEDYCKRYMAFMDAAKTEREATTWAVAEAQKNGFKPFEPGMSVKPGDKIYYNNRDKAIALAVIGTEPLSKGANICAAHVDSPRMDLKPNPLYEDAEIAYFKTHYYGGIKKYQWVTVPLALHGVVYRKDGSVITVTIGEDDNDPVLMISDLLIHLSADQMQKTAGKVIAGEQLNVILGTEPIEGEGGDLVKLNVMKFLNEKYGLIENDFLSAELTIVPAGRCREVGFDRSLISAYGHDDRVCIIFNLLIIKHSETNLRAYRERLHPILRSECRARNHLVFAAREHRDHSDGLGAVGGFAEDLALGDNHRIGRQKYIALAQRLGVGLRLQAREILRHLGGGQLRRKALLALETGRECKLNISILQQLTTTRRLRGKDEAVTLQFIVQKHIPENFEF